MTSVGCNEICSLDWCNHTGQTLSGEKKLLLNEVGTELHSALVAITTAHEADSSSSSTTAPAAPVAAAPARFQELPLWS